MRKAFLECLVESFACMNPMVYAYYLAAKHEAGSAASAPIPKDDAAERKVVRLVESLKAGEQASA